MFHEAHSTTTVLHHAGTHDRACRCVRCQNMDCTTWLTHGRPCPPLHLLPPNAAASLMQAEVPVRVGILEVATPSATIVNYE